MRRKRKPRFQQKLDTWVVGRGAGEDDAIGKPVPNDVTDGFQWVLAQLINGQREVKSRVANDLGKA